MKQIGNIKPTEDVLTVTDLRKMYKRGHETIHALDGVSFTVHKGEIVSIVGRSGSGKTTLLNQIGCLDTPSSGSISISGVNATEFKESELVKFRRNHIGFIFQLFFLIPTFTVMENVRLPLIFARERDTKPAVEALKKTGLQQQQFALLPSKLSGGDMQRVAIARALVLKPKLLLADEPTARLEAEAKQNIITLFKNLASEGLSIIIVTHDLNLANSADRILQLRDGKLEK